jgi:ferredoxin-like protein FixX
MNKTNNIMKKLSLLKMEQEMEDPAYTFKCARCKAEISIYDEKCGSCENPNKHYEEKKGQDLRADDWRCLECLTLNCLPSYSCKSK